MTEKEIIKNGSITDLRELLYSGRFHKIKHCDSFSFLIDRLEQLELDNILLRNQTEAKKTNDIPAVSNIQKSIWRLENALAYTIDAINYAVKFKYDEKALEYLDKAKDKLLKD